MQISQFPNLPILHILPELKEALHKRSAVLAAPPGSGKTTIVPLAFLEEQWLKGKKILILEPRRLAARAAASRMASLLGEQVGRTVGYQIRLDRKISHDTRIEVLTEGILTRRIQNDPDLHGVGLIIFDEFHERSVHGDLALALCLDICQLKDDLRLLVMSATLDTGPLAALLDEAPVITGEGQCHEVKIDYLKREVRGRIAEVTTAGIHRVVSEQQGDILVFLPGIGEIKEVTRLLAEDENFKNILVSPLFGNLSQQDQDRAILPDPGGRRRVILSTSIAETSLTIEGISCIVDSGWARRPQFIPDTGLSGLITIRVSKASADQRAGRAGRLGPGYCLRLWTQTEHYSLSAFNSPEIMNVDLSNLALELALWGIADPQELHWLDTPRSGPYKQACELLKSMEALDAKGQITGFGKQLAALPIHPRLGRMMFMAKSRGRLLAACDLAAILSERDILKRGGGLKSADLSLRLEMLESWRQKGSDAIEREGGDSMLCQRVDKTSKSYKKMIGGESIPQSKDLSSDLLVYGYPDRIARRRDNQKESYVLATGRGVKLASGDPLGASEYLVVPHLDASHIEGKIFLAASLDFDDLQRHHSCLFSLSEEVFWDDTSAKVVAMSRILLQELVIEEHPLKEVKTEVLSRAMLSGIRKMGINSLGWDEKIRQFQARVLCLRELQPESEWPDLSDINLMKDLSWLEPYLVGINRADQLKKINLLEIFKSILGNKKQQQLEQEAPGSFVVPSGSKITIEYNVNEPPVLAVRIQEMFGQAETPAILGGKMPLRLHLLSPAGRPIQITSDLAGFWQGSYREVKKELKGRYPKHYWPDDPLMAEATRGVKRSGNKS